MLLYFGSCGAGPFEVDAPMTRAEAVISMASAIDTSATFAEAEFCSRVVDFGVTSSCSDSKVLKFDAPTNHSGADSMILAFNNPTIYASFVSQAWIVDTLTHSFVGNTG